MCTCVYFQKISGIKYATYCGVLAENAVDDCKYEGGGRREGAKRSRRLAQKSGEPISLPSVEKRKISVKCELEAITIIIQSLVETQPEQESSGYPAGFL
ncbi:Hypothetical protein CINCED_3A014338 [Cinara cedri]|uniref:Uncharacterized protein n=1 Tax=Cinara cedri TaxID=506608 RepID=A0A5E4N288_9HEMI|nr:Hypothetical protein CINCED_3A014338 [Cinara cedri]